MRHEALVAALVAFCGYSCSGPAARGDGQTPAAGQQGGAVSSAGASAGLRNVVFSGCTEGAPLVKVLIQLRPTQTPRGCSAEVTPGSVCVARGGVVRFQIDNGCGDRAFEISQPQRKKLAGVTEAEAAKADAAKVDAAKVDARPEDWQVFANCSLKVPGTGLEILRCDVGKDVLDGFYKYGLQGERVDPLDPDVEVRGGR